MGRLTAEWMDAYASRIRAIRQEPEAHPETSLYGPLEQLLLQALAAWRPKGSVIAQRRTPRQHGVPDFCLRDEYGHPFAYVEAKAPGTDLENLRGPEREQLDRYRELPCVLYTNFWELRLYLDGEVAAQARLLERSALDPDGRKPPPHDDGAAQEILERVFTFQPGPLATAGEVARAIARRARLVRSVVAELVEEEASPLRSLHDEFRTVLFADLTGEQFAHAYAQTLAYGLLLARIQNQATDLTLGNAHEILGADHRLLSAVLRLLGQREVTDRIGWSAEALLATIRLVAPEALSRRGKEEPTLYFYEDFLAEYDPALRKQVGVYYTPLPVVDFQLRAVEQVLGENLGIEEGFGAEQVTVLDPATGTGTYLLAALRREAERAESDRGKGAVAGALSSFARRAFGFELLVGPYAVAHWKLGTYLHENGVPEAAHIVLADTLQAPRAGDVAGRFGFMSEALTAERHEAERIKSEQPVLVVLGNPPYGRTNLRADDAASTREMQHWKWIWDKVSDFKEGVPDDERVNLKNLADRYVLFYRWAFWKLLEQGTGKGVVSFITNRSWLSGGAFAGMRAFMRAHFGRIAIVDLGGDNRAAKLANEEADENVFEIETGVAIAVCVREGSTEKPGEREEASRPQHSIEYVRLRGRRDEKHAALAKLRLGEGFARVPGEGGDSFVPRGSASFLAWPSLADLFAERFSGIETKRDELVVGVRIAQLQHAFQRLGQADPEAQRQLFHETRDRKLPEAEAMRFDVGCTVPYAYRPLDRRFLYLDDAFVDYAREKGLQACWGDENLALVTLPRGHGEGPAVWIVAQPPDRHAFRGSYGGHVFPLWDDRKKEDRRRAKTNLRPELLAALSDAYGEVDPEEVFDYLYGLLQAPSYTRRFREELQQSFPRVPFPKSQELFRRVVRRGKELSALHSLALLPKRGQNPTKLEGPDALIFEVAFDEKGERVDLGGGRFLTNVTAAMWEFQVSGYRVLRRFLEARKGLDLGPEELREALAVVYAIRKTVEAAPHLDDAFGLVLSNPTLELTLAAPTRLAHAE